MAIRITGGEFRGRLLDVPGKGVRPTQDKVRAAVFSSLQAVIPGARVLDLFAGAGAFGLEALSRGAAFACFVESDHKALLYLAKNAERLLGNPVGDCGKFTSRNFKKVGRGVSAEPSDEERLTRSVRPTVRKQKKLPRFAAPNLFGRKWRIARNDVEQFLEENKTQAPYDIIFADPPYDTNEEWTKKILFHLSSGAIFSAKGYLVIESGVQSPLIEAEGWKIEWNRTYGETRICMYRQMKAD